MKEKKKNKWIFENGCKTFTIGKNGIAKKLGVWFFGLKYFSIISYVTVDVVERYEHVYTCRQI